MTTKLIKQFDKEARKELLVESKNLKTYKGILNRYNSIIKFLEKHDIPYNIEEEGSTINIIVSFREGSDYDVKRTVIGAHYDIVPGSLGLNDNGCAIAVLLDLALYFKNNTHDGNKNVDLVFFDKEETGMLGSRLYIKNNKEFIDKVLILDVIGFGDDLYYCNHRDSKIVSKALQEKGLRKYNSVMVSDNVVFSSYGIDNALVVAIPDVDVVPVKENVYAMRKDSHVRFHEGMHNRMYDNDIDWINFDLVNKAKELVKELIMEGF